MVDHMGSLDEMSRAQLFNLRGFCRELLGDVDGAGGDFGEAILLDPDEPRWYPDRADFWERQNLPDLADRDNENRWWCVQW